MRVICRIIKYLLLSVFGFILIFLIILLVPALWHRWVTYPKLEKARNEFLELRKQTQPLVDLKTYRGIMHAHSCWSHDSEGSLYGIITAAKANNIDFIFLTDHPHGDIDTFPRGLSGSYDGVIIEPGSESQGFAVWPMKQVVLDWTKDRNSVAKNVMENGGLIFHSHPEEPHNLSGPYYQGMEIYNFHADTKDEKVLPSVINLLVNGNKFRSWGLRQMFDEQTDILRLWDSLNCTRKTVGYSAVDIHENQNIRARYLKDGRIQWIGPDARVIGTSKVSPWNRWLLHEPDSSGWIFRIMIDTYMAGFSHITNYVLADSLTSSDLCHHIKEGHLFSAFKFLGDASGFVFCASDQDDNVSCIMGDSLNLEKIKSFKAVSPYPGQFSLIHNGKVVNTSATDSWYYSWGDLIEKGAYRLEVRILLNGKYVPWVYTNPIYIY